MNILNFFYKAGNNMYNYLMYVWYVHPTKVYYALIIFSWIVSVMCNVAVAEAAGEKTLEHMVANKLRISPCVGMRLPSFPYTHNIEVFQHVQIATAMHNSVLPQQGWLVVPSRINPNLVNLPDAIITNGTEVLPIQHKASLVNNLNLDKTVKRMAAYAATADLLHLSCVHQESYDEVCTKVIPWLIANGRFTPDLLVSRINIQGVWGDLSIEQQKGIMYALDMQSKGVTNKLYSQYNDAMDAHTSLGKQPATLFTPEPDEELKQKVIQLLKKNMLHTGITSKACLLSEISNTQQLQL